MKERSEKYGNQYDRKNEKRYEKNVGENEMKHNINLINQNSF